MVNTYVWSAGGGTYAESEGFSTELTECFSLGRSSEVGFGFNFSVFFTVFGAGVTIEGQVSDAVGTSFSATKSFTSNRRSEEHTSELQSLMRISYAVFCL